MKRTIFIIISFLLICGVLVGCKKKEKVKEYVIEFESNKTTGYTWSYEIEKDGIIEVESNYLLNNQETGVVGVGGKEKFIIKGLKKGTTTIKFTYSRPWEPKNTDKTETYKITVDKNLNITGKNIK